MGRRLALSCLLVGFALVTAASARAAGQPSPLPAGSFVVDGGDLEDPCLAPWAAAAAQAVTPSTDAAVALADDATAAAQAASAPRPRAVEYSDGYRTRLKIHKYASFATLPVFVAQYAVGQKLYDGTGSDGTRSAHQALVVATAVLFGANTVTGVWNLREGRKDPSHRTKRMVHGLLMLAADAGFVATGMLAPESEHDSFEGGFEGDGGGHSRSTHRTVALVSMGVATVSYLMMLIGD